MTKKKIIAGFMALSIAMSTAALPCGAIDTAVGAETVSSAAVAEETTVVNSGLASSGYTVKEYLKKLDDQNIYYEYDETEKKLTTFTDYGDYTAYKYGDFLCTTGWGYLEVIGYIGKPTECYTGDYIITIPEKINGMTVESVAQVLYHYAYYNETTKKFEDKDDTYDDDTYDYNTYYHTFYGGFYYINDWDGIVIPSTVGTMFLDNTFYDIEYGEKNDTYTWNEKVLICYADTWVEYSAAANGIPYTVFDADGNFATWTPKVSTKYSSTTKAVTISWDKIDIATGYRVYRYNASKKKWENVKTISGNGNTTYTDTKLTAGTAYKYKVKTYRKVKWDKYTETSWSYASDVVTTATKPSTMKFTASSSSKTAVRLKWNKVNATGYKLQQYNAATKTWKTVKTLKQSETEYKITGLKKGTSYKFRIQAYKTGGAQKAFGSWSATKTVTTKK
jgi:hypothetical protein